jgi:hypothetical protein
VDSTQLRGGAKVFEFQSRIDICGEGDEQPMGSFGEHEFRIALDIEMVKFYSGNGRN